MMKALQLRDMKLGKPPPKKPALIKSKTLGRRRTVNSLTMSIKKALAQYKEME